MKKELSRIVPANINECVEIIQKIPQDIRIIGMLIPIAYRHYRYLEFKSAMEHGCNCTDTITPTKKGIGIKRSFTNNSAN